METVKISGSDLAGCRSPLEFYQRKFLHKPVEKYYFDIGTAAHAYILQQDKFNEDVICVGGWPEPDKINKDGTYSKLGKNGKYLEEQKELNPDKIVFEPVVYNNVISYAEGIKLIPGFSNFINLQTGIAEQDYETIDPETGLTLRGRQDYIKPGKFIADLKFCNSISDFELAKAFRDFEYHLRAAFYLDLYNACTGEDLNTFIYICVEKSENPTARFLKMSELDLNAGREIYKNKLKVIAECFKTGEWILSSIENFQLPEWVYKSNQNW